MAKVTLKSGAVLEVADVLYAFVQQEVLPGTGRTAEAVFQALGELVEEFGPQNQELLEARSHHQRRIDQYYQEKRRAGWQPTPESAEQDAAELERFLVEIGYLQPARTPEFTMSTPALDGEMDLNGPELVTPVTNASMAVGGANARWGSLYDAYFLSDIHPEIDRESRRPERLRMVVEETNAFLEGHVAPWEGNVTYDDITSYSVSGNPDGGYQLAGHTADGSTASLADGSRFVGFNLDDSNDLAEFFLEDNGLKIQVQLYPGGKVHEENGQFRDLFVESAVTNIVDFEDAVSIVDAWDMTLALRNYLGLLRGDLEAHGSRGILKTINSDKTYLDVQGNQQSVKATSLMSVRNVSLHMYTDMVTLDAQEIPERFLGVLLTTLIWTSHDKGSNGEAKGSGEEAQFMPVRAPNSGKGFVYQVTPKLQTAAEVAEQVRLFDAIEQKLGLASGTILIGIMNEELGMTLQLPEALQAAQSRTFFTNTGFLDRTGSQIRSQMQSGPVDLRDDLTQHIYNTSYELHNVDESLQAGVHLHGKIGKGMQVRNRAMAEMMERKIDHPRTGGNTAWVPAPYPSDLHSMHYHMIDVAGVQRTMTDLPALNVSRQALLTFPLLDRQKLNEPGAAQQLLLRYIHSMVAYIEPWVHRGIGCTGVQNFDRIEEMKDRATERIDGAIIANWKLHDVVSQEDIEKAIGSAAEIVDGQNAGAEGYVPMTDTPEKREAILNDPAIVAVLQIIDEAASSDSAYVEPALFRNRRVVKAPGG